MKEFIGRLGKKLQSLLDKIFGKKKSEWEITGFTTISRDEVSQEEWDKLMTLFDDGEAKDARANFSPEVEIQKKIVNIPYPKLPRRIFVETLLVSLVANTSCPYQVVDLSQYEEKGLAHFIVGSTRSWEELFQEWWAIGRIKDSDDAEWAVEGLESAKEHGIFSAVTGPAYLLYYEDTKTWQYEEVE